jgi:hypothetical protein
MEYVYILICGSEWEDMIIYIKEEEAIEVSIKYPELRVEIFSKNNNNNNGYSPTYNYYKNGKLIINT